MLASLVCLVGSLCATDPSAFEGSWHVHLGRPGLGYCGGSLHLYAHEGVLVGEAELCGEPMGVVYGAVVSNEAILMLPGEVKVRLTVDGDTLAGANVQGWRGEECPGAEGTVRVWRSSATAAK